MKTEMEVSPYYLVKGDSPLIVSMPHVGTGIPKDIKGNLSDAGLKLVDTDWHVDQLYDFLGDLGASVITARYSRYVVDLNRPSDGKPLYEGADETKLCPLTTFAKEALYKDGAEPNEDEVKRRCEAYWQPYHDELVGLIARAKEKHGFALLWDAHSIKSVVPRFFDGKLPDLNFGTAGGLTVPKILSFALKMVAEGQNDFTSVINGRFKGGYITRHYGAPEDKIFSVQMELSQATYMNELTFDFDEDKANKIRPLLKKIMKIFTAYKP
jgi:N-formylglutamate deformylase